MKQTIEQLLKDFGCVEIDATSSRFLDDGEFYLMILKQMLSDPGFESLEKSLRDHDAKTAFETAHMLKGIISNCGITPMYEIIQRIVESLRNGNLMEAYPAYEKLMESRSAFTEKLNAFVP